MAYIERTLVLETTNAVEAGLYRGMLEEAGIAVAGRIIHEALAHP